MSKNADSTQNGKGQLDFSKVKIPPGSSDLPSAEKALLQVPVVPLLNSRLFGFAAKILVTSNARLIISGDPRYYANTRCSWIIMSEKSYLKCVFRFRRRFNQSLLSFQ